LPAFVRAVLVFIIFIVFIVFVVFVVVIFVIFVVIVLFVSHIVRCRLHMATQGLGHLSDEDDRQIVGGVANHVSGEHDASSLW